MPSASLSGRALLDVKGDDAEDFLQNIITTDLDTLGKGDLKSGALLTPQGKILFEFLVSRNGAGLRLDLNDSSIDELVKRLTLYRLRAKVQFVVDKESLVTVSWNDNPSASEIDSILTDRRFPESLSVRRRYGEPADAGSDVDAWNALRIAYGVAEAPDDYALGEAFPHDVNFDQTGGVSFKKGCFVGQEVVSRMQHRGTARRRILVAAGAADLPAQGTPLTAGGREIGTLGTVVAKDGLALVRIDRVKDAMDSGMPIMAGDVAVHLAIPPEHRFTFPVTTQEA
ncbi:CAF17-like 4Fe-4S cluster assembly/insertion protein YgfZ [Phyllobacterium pellucidum]|uniref:CAF17-like 4Fe-4S cluster assembly/insertion protein YgfZ n=1 Tax=Phyllobacterium pellucidum TaxID=2740464 RepID=UPI001D13D0B4|nr:folate-binding protein YgfZ [Phyllobacterium sp. T1018]UGY08131.1 folate-binding protein YgfZ [Phyllobacterium sp. T1018]